MDTLGTLPPGQYAIYALIDPTDEMVYYVGQTRNPQRRLEQHMAARHHEGEKGDWLRRLIQKDQQPLMQVLEKVTDEKAALEKEQVWIRHFVEKKMPLVNAQVRPRKNRPRPSAIPHAEVYHISWEHLFADLFSHSKRENSTRSPKAPLTIREKIKENLSLIAEMIESLKTLEAEYKKLDAQYEEERLDFQATIAAHSHIVAARVYARRGVPIAETLAALAAHFQVKDMYDLPESAWPAVLDWFASLLED